MPKSSSESNLQAAGLGTKGILVWFRFSLGTILVFVFYFDVTIFKNV